MGLNGFFEELKDDQKKFGGDRPDACDTLADGLPNSPGAGPGYYLGRRGGRTGHRKTLTLTNEY